jgi:hypothetical protein
MDGWKLSLAARWAGGVVVLVLAGCGDASPDLDEVAAETCVALEGRLADVTVWNPPHMVVDEHLVRLELDSDDVDEVRYRLAPERCPEVFASAEAAYDADSLRFEGESPSGAEVEEELAVIARRILGRDADEEAIAAFATLTEHYCVSGADDDAVEVFWLARIADGTGDEIPGMFYELDGYGSYERAWGEDDELAAAARDLPRHPETGAIEFERSPVVWDEAATGFCRRHRSD